MPLGIIFEQQLIEQYPTSSAGPPYGMTTSYAVFITAEGIDSFGQRRRASAADAFLIGGWRAPAPLLSTTTWISLTTVGATDLYTVPSGKMAYLIGALVEIEYAQACTSDATAGIGVSVGESDIFAPQQLIMTRSTGDLWLFPAQGKLKVAPAGSIIRFGVDTGATATTLLAKVHLLGYLLP